jgi:shikimate dehydrogenase
VTGPLVRLAVLGDPLAYTRSPDLHRAGLTALGLTGESVTRRTTATELSTRLADLAGLGFLGANLTHPLKEAALAEVVRVSEASRLARSVNTVGFAADGWWGETTDGPGLVDLLRSLGRDPLRGRAVMLGAGGAARSLALALTAAGAAAVTVSARRPQSVRDAWRGIPGARMVGWRSADEADALRDATLVINATPLGAEDDPAPLAGIARRALILDLVYGAQVTPWVRHARAEGREAYDGLGLLVFQARRSLALWLARAVPVDPLARAVGWPR